MEEADRSGARLVLGDRDQDATVRALREALDFSDILRLISGSNRGGNGYEWMDPELARRFASADWSDPERAVELLKTRRATAGADEADARAISARCRRHVGRTGRHRDPPTAAGVSRANGGGGGDGAHGRNRGEVARGAGRRRRVTAHLGVVGVDVVRSGVDYCRGCI